MKALYAGVLSSLLVAVPASAQQIGYIESFSLAKDREEALKQLIPGTEDYYYYHALHYQNTEQYDKVEQILPAWIKRYKYTARVREIQNRQALLTYEKNPQETLAHLRKQLGLTFNHQREQLEKETDLPSRLDPNRISRETLTADAMRRYKNLQGFEDSALDWLAEMDLDPDRRRHLLQRLARPDVPGLPKLVVADLNHKYSGGFGSFGIHRQMLLAQLEECLRLEPDLLNQTHFVNTYLTKLQPNPDVDWRHDAEAKEAHLERMWSFARRLAPVHNSLKAHVLYYRLLLDRSRGIYDHDRFLTYIKLPRNVSYIERAYMQRPENRRHPANLGANYEQYTLLPPVGNDELLVRSYLQHFFVEAADYDTYTDYINDIYLKHLFAETKIVNGLGEGEKWYSLLPPAKYQAIKERIDLDFAYTNKETFAADEPVSLDVHVKNVRQLIVKVFEINTRNYYRDQRREVNTDINLDGLVANEETTHTYEEPPLRRVRRHFDFASLTERGVYVVDFIGNGRSSRAVIRKGKLRYLSRTTSAGHHFVILDEKNNKLPDATLWLAGHEYKPDENGVILVPFTNQPGRQPIILCHGDFCSLDYFQHDAENYALNAGIYVDREALLKRKKAQLIIRPQLTVAGSPASLSVLENVRLVIESKDLEGISTKKEVEGFELHADKESTYEFQVPERLAELKVTLRAKVENLSKGEESELATGETFSLNAIDRTEKVEDLFISQFGENYVVNLLGKSGEVRPRRAVHFELKHRDFNQPVRVTLQTDGAGSITLGPLAGIDTVKATGPEGTSHTWPLRRDRHTHPQSVHGKAGEVVQIPLMEQVDEAKHEDVSLLELRGGTFVADRLDAVAIDNGRLRISDLPRGDYDLLLKDSGTRIQIRLAEGERRGSYVLGDYRHLEVRQSDPLQIAAAEPNEEKVQVRLVGATPRTRVHVFATRFRPAYDPFGHFARILRPEPYRILLPKRESAYIIGRDIGDEYRYIIDRKYATKYPGNMLGRPSLLLNPWAVRKTETGEQLAALGGQFGGKAEQQYGGRGRPDAKPAAPVPAGDFSDLDFLANAPAVLVNLRPDEQGVIRIDREKLGPHALIHIVAVDRYQTVSRALSLGQPKTDTLDLRLATGLDPQKHFTEQKQISVVTAGETFELEDITTSRFQAYDSLAKVYGLYATLSGNANLKKFGFILRWPELEAEEKRSKYSEFACHELNFFLYKKDPKFFEEVVKPYLENKLDRTFMDEWLLGEDLSRWLPPWMYEQLNIAERILLAQRIEGERQYTSRHVADLYDLQPPDIDRFNRLFNTAIKSGALDTEDHFGYGDAQAAATRAREGQARAEMESLDAPQAPPADQTTGDPGTAAPRPESDPGARSGRRNADETKTDDLREHLKKADKEASRLQRDADGVMDDALLADELDNNAQKDRKAVRQFYRKLDKTKEWAENNYYELPIEQQNASLIVASAFWRDYAEHDPAEPFLSIHLAEAARNFPEMMFALALLDLPFEPEEHKTEFDGPQMTLTAGSPLVVYHEEIRPSELPKDQARILVSQNFFRYGDRYRYENNERLDKFVTDEFLVHVPYGCQIVVTNPTSAPKKLNVLLQVPQGALPVLGGKYTRTAHIDLQPYSTQTFEYYFYFPARGKYVHYPVHVARDEALIAFAEPFTFNVVEKLTQIDHESWDYVSQFGTEEQVLEFLQGHNLHRLNLEKIAFRMSDQAFFEKVLAILSRRHAYNHTLWSYGIKHNDVAAARQYLQHADGFVQQCGKYLESRLLTIDPVLRKDYQHLAYRPLVNARTHQLGRQREIVNDRFRQQYHELLDVLSYRRALGAKDLIEVTYYMLLQDRIGEAMEFFGQVNRGDLPTQLQYDYFAAYLDFYNEQPKVARVIAEKHADHPVDRWQNQFDTMLTQLEEIEGGRFQVVDKEDRTQSQTELASTEPNFDFKVEAKQIAVHYQNLESVRVNYYLMDVELLFSRNPFVQEFAGGFSYIRPNATQTVKLPADKTTHTIPLPEQFHNTNVLVELVGAGNTKAQAYYSNSLSVQLVENYGQLRVTRQEDNRPLRQVYVKVYAQQKDGRIKFYKDGYTDLRGRFDYTSLNTNQIDFTQKLSLLVLSEEHGAIVREAMPPKQ